jgi:hypothetical protein
MREPFSEPGRLSLRMESNSQDRPSLGSCFSCKAAVARSWSGLAVVGPSPPRADLDG